MGKLEDDVERDFAGMPTGKVQPSTGGTVNLDDLTDEEWRQMILARLEGVKNAVRRLARRLDQLG